MSKSAVSIFVFGIYLLIIGVGLLVAPDFLLGTYSVPGITDIFIRIIGMFIFYLGIYYVMAARHELIIFFRWTVYLRSTVILFFGTFVVLGYAQPQIIFLALIDLLGAIWTGFAIRSQKPLLKSN